MSQSTFVYSGVTWLIIAKFLHHVQYSAINAAVNAYIDVAIFQFNVENQRKEWILHLSIFSICPQNKLVTITTFLERSQSEYQIDHPLQYVNQSWKFGLRYDIIGGICQLLPLRSKPKGFKNSTLINSDFTGSNLTKVLIHVNGLSLPLMRCDNLITFEMPPRRMKVG